MKIDPYKFRSIVFIIHSILLLFPNTLSASMMDSSILMHEFTKDWLNCNDSSWVTTKGVCEWQGVTCTTPNNQITKFDWSYGGGVAALCESTSVLNISSLPATMTIVDLLYLPSTLTILDLSNNLFTGTLHFSSLPSNLTQLYLNNNQFSGVINFSVLPSTLTTLNL
eukprot:PhF_6_TR26339/c0_g1_i1/m.37889